MAGNSMIKASPWESFPLAYWCVGMGVLSLVGGSIGNTTVYDNFTTFSPTFTEQYNVTTYNNMSTMGLEITSRPNENEDNDWWTFWYWLLLIAIGGLIIIIAVVVICVCCCKRCKRSQEDDDIKLDEFHQVEGPSEATNYASDNEPPQELYGNVDSRGNRINIPIGQNDYINERKNDPEQDNSEPFYGNTTQESYSTSILQAGSTLEPQIYQSGDLDQIDHQRHVPLAEEDEAVYENTTLKQPLNSPLTDFEQTKKKWQENSNKNIEDEQAPIPPPRVESKQQQFNLVPEPVPASFVTKLVPTRQREEEVEEDYLVPDIPADIMATRAPIPIPTMPTKPAKPAKPATAAKPAKIAKPATAAKPTKPSKPSSWLPQADPDETTYEPIEPHPSMGQGFDVQPAIYEVEPVAPQAYRPGPPMPSARPPVQRGYMKGIPGQFHKKTGQAPPVPIHNTSEDNDEELPSGYVMFQSNH